MTNADRILAAYDEAEAWKADHDASMQSFDMQEVIVFGNMAYEFISFIDATWQEYVARGKLLFKEEDDRQIGEFYRKWVEISERRIDEIGRLTRKGYEIQGADRFLTLLEEARAILESRALEGAMRPIEDILLSVKGNPRPERYGK
jgi:hypothetical protein